MLWCGRELRRQKPTEIQQGCTQTVFISFYYTAVQLSVPYFELAEWIQNTDWSLTTGTQRFKYFCMKTQTVTNI